MKYLGRHRIILDKQNSKPYLERFYLFIKERDDFPFNIFLHRFLNSDPDDLHDHPWNFRSIILLGGYWEYTEKGKIWRGPLSYKYSDASLMHRIELDENINYCWTLFIPGKKIRNWGFNTKTGWVQHEKYFEDKFKKTNKVKFKKYYTKNHKKPFYKKI